MTTAVAAAGVGTAARAGVEVRLENLRRRYAGVTALDGLSLTMAPGELVALLGPSGCGKTTALRLVAGLEQADTGRIVVAGEDVKGRARVRDEIRRVQLEGGITTLFVTHDQEEALAIADRVGVMHSGRLEQLGPPTAIYSRPATPFVAEFVGLTNRLPGVVRGREVEVRGTRLPLVQPDTADGPAVALVRPEAVTFASDVETGAGALVGTVIAVAFLGATSRVTVDLGDMTVLAQLPTSEASAHPAGSRVRLALRPDPVLIARDEASSKT